MSTKLFVEELKRKIRLCHESKDAEFARRIYFQVLATIPHHRKNRYLCNLLLDLLGECGCLDQARKIFQTIDHPNVYSFNIMLKICIRNRSVDEAWNLFATMTERNQASWNVMLAAVARDGEMHKVKKFFEEMSEKNVVSWTTFLSAHLRSGLVEEAKEIFDTIEDRNVVTWNTMIEGYVEKRHSFAARMMFDKIPCRNAMVISSMISAYGRDGDLNEAKKLFDAVLMKNRSTWNALLAAYAQNGQKYVEEAKEIFRSMPCSDRLSWTSLIHSLCRSGKAEEAGEALDRMPFLKTVVDWTMLIDAYSKSGNVEEARRTFDRIPDPDFTAVNVMISAYGQHGHLHAAVSLFGVARERGKVDLISENIIISAYASSGRCEQAKAVFDAIERKDVCSWTVLVRGYVMNGLPKQGLEAFHEMLLDGTSPNRITLISTLLAARQPAEAGEIFVCMASDFDIRPTIEHYDCLVGVLGKDRRLEEAEELVDNMPFLPDARIWMTLLGCCRKHGNVKFGKLAAERLFQLDPNNVTPYVILGEIYSNCGRSKEVQLLKKAFKDKGLRKLGSCSWIQVGDEVHKFHVGDLSHPCMKEIHNEVARLMKLMKVAKGYEQEILSWGDSKAAGIHSEKLAMAYGLLSIDKDEIFITNNLRMCSDCHLFAKLIPEVTNRKIVVRDVQQLHHFKDAACSCGDAW